MLNIIKHYKFWFAVSGIILVAGIVSLAVFHLSGLEPSSFFRLSGTETTPRRGRFFSVPSEHTGLVTPESTNYVPPYHTSISHNLTNN